MLNPSNVRRRWHAPALAAAGLEHVRLHDLRHTATLAIAAGESVLYVQAQTQGHTDERTTMRYAHADHQAHRAAAARVDAYLG